MSESTGGNETSRKTQAGEGDLYIPFLLSSLFRYFWKMKSTTSDIAVLGRPVHFPLSGKTAANRIYKSAQSEYACTYDKMDRDKCGKPTASYIEHYQREAICGHCDPNIG
jgi:hypothetical protein